MKPSLATWLGWTALLVAVVLIVVALTVPADAQEPICISLDRMAFNYEAVGIPVWRVPPEGLVSLMLATNHKVKRATRALVIQNDPLSGGNTVIGYEVDGCLTPPFFVQGAPPVQPRPIPIIPIIPGIEA